MHFSFMSEKLLGFIPLCGWHWSRPLDSDQSHMFVMCVFSVTRTFEVVSSSSRCCLFCWWLKQLAGETKSHQSVREHQLCHKSLSTVFLCSADRLHHPERALLYTTDYVLIPGFTSLLRDVPVLVGLWVEVVEPGGESSRSVMCTNQMWIF